MTVELNPCTVANLNALRAISTDTFVETFADHNTAEDMAQYVATAFAPEVLERELATAGSAFFLARVDGEIAGYLKVNSGDAQTEKRGDDCLEVERIYALSRFKGQGLGRLMMERAIAEAHARGLGTVWLGVWEMNESAIHFYEHLGFVVAGEHTFVLGGDPQRDLIMELRLPR